MQYLSVIALLAASFSGALAKKSDCSNGNFNKYGAQWPRDMFSGKDGATATIQQFCSDVNKSFKHDEEKWDCRKYGDLKLKVMIKETNSGNLQIGEAFCKEQLKFIVNDCSWGGNREEWGWKFSAHASKSDCGK